MLEKNSILGTLDSVALTARGREFARDCYMLSPIDEQQLTLIREEKPITVSINGNEYDILYKDIIMFGKIDVFAESDINLIESNNFFEDILSKSPNYMPSDFDYNSDTLPKYNKDNPYRERPANSATEWFRYCYYRIGKPAMVVCFKINQRNL